MSEPKRVQRAVELDAALAARLDAAAKERTVSKRWLMERLISDGLDRLIPVDELRITRDVRSPSERNHAGEAEPC